MTIIKSIQRSEAGFSFTELMVVLMGMTIILAAAVPVVTSSWSSYRLILTAQSITSQLQFARMKSVSSNESFQVHFLSGSGSYRVEDSTGRIVSGPFFLPTGVTWNSTDGGSGIGFPGGLVPFTPTGTIPAASNSRVKLINQAGYRIDIAVGTGGVIRQTPTYKASLAPF